MKFWLNITSENKNVKDEACDYKIDWVSFHHAEFMYRVLKLFICSVFLDDRMLNG